MEVTMTLGNGVMINQDQTNQLIHLGSVCVQASLSAKH